MAPAIIALWHGQHLLAPAIYQAARRASSPWCRAAPTPRSTRWCVEKLGLEAVRGSGGRDSASHLDKGGARALIALKKALDAGKNVAMIADIPKGTPREAGLGIVTLAKLSGRPIVPLAVATSRRKVLEKSWDKTTINLPFGRGAAIVGDPILVPADAGEAEMEEKRQEVTAASQRGDRAGLSSGGRRPMSERWARAMLSAYRFAGAAAYPLVGGYVGWRANRGKEDRSRRRERYGIASRPRPNGPLVWVHAASVGETIAVIPLIERILGFGIHVVLTTGTVTSARVADERLGQRIIHQYVPLDLKPAVSRFLDHWEPDLAIIAESEIWPMTILELGARRVPQVLVNGRLSDRSFASWKKRAFLAEALFENLAHVVAQSEVDGERFRALGARPVTVSGNLKVDTDPPPADERALADLHAPDRFATRPGRRFRRMTARKRSLRKFTRCCARATRAC